MKTYGSSTRELSLLKGTILLTICAATASCGSPNSIAHQRDAQTPNVIVLMRDLKIESDTVVFFCSDNGPGDRLAKKGVASAGPFKGHKHHMYEGGLLVPACAEWPGVIQPGATTDVRCSTVDYFPTIANIVGYELSSRRKRPIGGIDLMPVINGQVTERPADLFFGFRRLHDGTDGKAIISGHYKLLKEAKEKGQMRLFDLKSDPGEQHDILKKMPAVFDAMARKLKAVGMSCQLSRDGADYSY